MKSIKSIIQSFLSYSKSQRIGVVLLFSIIVLVQGIYLFVDFSTAQEDSFDKFNWLAFQKDIDSARLQKANYKSKLYPFNPNFITDFKGYQLGMSVEEIDRLLAFRKQNKFINSAEEFQAVTNVSDSLLRVMAPYFKFPDWVRHKREFGLTYPKTNSFKNEKSKVLDINEATKEELMKVYGIGDKISDRILEQKEKLGGFVSMEQMQDVWGISPEVFEKLKNSFIVKATLNIKKININNASIKELTQFPYFKYSLAKEVVVYRSMHGDIKLEDLSKIKGFPVERIKIIALYLEF